jgi:ribosomal protein S18 acetylase RimI-like enzyme
LTLLERLQTSLGEIAALDRERVRVGPFTGYVDAVRTTKYHSFALPDPGAPAGELAAALPGLRDAYASRDRNARTEHIVEVCPALEDVLVADGWALSERMPVMACTPESYAAPPGPAELLVERLRPDSPEARVRGFLTAERAAFQDDSPITAKEIARWRARAAQSFSMAGVADGAVVGTALCSPIFGGITEVAGVATLPAHRGRGVAAALTAAVVEAAFAAGAEVAWLTAAGPSAQGIYARAGFGVFGTLLAYDAP